MGFTAFQRSVDYNIANTVFRNDVIAGVPDYRAQGVDTAKIEHVKFELTRAPVDMALFRFKEGVPDREYVFEYMKTNHYRPAVQHEGRSLAQWDKIIQALPLVILGTTYKHPGWNGFEYHPMFDVRGNGGHWRLVEPNYGWSPNVWFLGVKAPPEVVAQPVAAAAVKANANATPEPLQLAPASKPLDLREKERELVEV